MRRQILPLAVLLLCGNAVAADGTELELAPVTIWGSLVAPPAPADATSDPAFAERIAAFTQAGDLLRSGFAAEAARKYEALAQASGWPEARYGAALALLGTGHVGAAREHAAQASAGRPEDPVFLYLTGVLQHATGRHEDAARTMTAAVERARSQGAQGVLALGLLNLGHSLRMLGRPEEARTRYREARDVAQRAGDSQLQADAWMGEGFTSAWLGDWKSAEAAWGKANSMLGPDAAGATRAESTSLRARRALEQGKTQDATQLVDEALALLGRVSSPVERAETLLGVADLEHALARPQADAHLEEARAAFQQAGLQLQQARVLRVRAGWALDRGDRDQAARDAEGAVGVEEGLQAPLALAQSRLLLAQIRGAQGRAPDGLTLAQKALDVFSRSRSLTGEVNSLRILSDLAEKSQDPARAAAWAKKARERARAGGDTGLAIQTAAEYAELLASQGDPDAAGKEMAALPAADLAQAPLRLRFRPQYERVRALLGQKRAADALTVARAAWEMSRTATGADVEWKDLARTAMVECLIADGKTAEAERFVADQGGDARLQAAIADAASTGLQNAAVDAWEKGDWEGAAKRWEELLARPGLSAERRGRAASGLLGAHLMIAQRHEDATRLQDAQQRYLAARELARTSRDLGAEVRAVLGLSRVRSALQDPKEALAYATQGTTLAQALGDRDLLGDAWNRLGEQLGEEDAAAAVRAFDTALMAWAGDSSTLDAQASAAYNAAVLDAQLGHQDSARKRAKSAKDCAAKAGRTDIVGAAQKLLTELGT